MMNPFDPNAAYVPDALRRLFAAIDDVQREYPGGNSNEADASFREACKVAVSILGELCGEEDTDWRLYSEDEFEEAVEREIAFRRNEKKVGVESAIDRFKEEIMESVL